MKTINALLSCPSDVISNFKNEIEQAVDDVNFYIEKILDTHIKVQHYSTSSFSQVGKPAQDHLDDTLIISSDICLAFYYHRLGTPTKDYRSGTDEEIHLMKSMGKHVLLFRIVDVDNKKKCEKELDDYFDSISSFSFYRIINGKENIFDSVRSDLINYLVSSFNVELIKMGNPLHAVDFFKRIINYDNKKKKIANLINAINNFAEEKSIAIERTKTVTEESKNKDIYQNLLDNEQYTKIVKLAEITQTLDLSKIGKEEVSETDIFDNVSIKYLNAFIKENSLSTREDFLSFHNEKVYRSTIPFNEGLCLENCPIKTKIEKLIELAKSLESYYEWANYFKKYEDLVLIPLAILNNTTSSQHSLNVVLKIKYQDYVPMLSLIPKKCVANEMYALTLDPFLNPHYKSYGYEEYEYQMFSPESYSNVFGTKTINCQETIKTWFMEYFDYKIEKSNEEVLIKAHFNNINSEEKHCFPTYLILKNTVKEIHHDIFGESLVRKKSGKIILTNR